MLYHETAGGFALWDGLEAVNGIQHPSNIELRATPSELAALGLFRPAAPDVPDGQRVVSQTVARIAGEVTFVYELEDVPPPTREALFAERDRRLAAGFDYNFGDGRGIHRIGTTPDDLIGWDDVTKYAAALIATGNGGAPISILTDTGVAVVTAQEWQLVTIAAAAFRQPVWGCSFMLGTMDPIPADFATNEAYWSVP